MSVVKVICYFYAAPSLVAFFIVWAIVSFHILALLSGWQFYLMCAAVAAGAAVFVLALFGVLWIARDQ